MAERSEQQHARAAPSPMVTHTGSLASSGEEGDGLAGAALGARARPSHQSGWRASRPSSPSPSAPRSSSPGEPRSRVVRLGLGARARAPARARGMCMRTDIAVPCCVPVCPCTHTHTHTHTHSRRRRGGRDVAGAERRRGIWRRGIFNARDLKLRTGPLLASRRLAIFSLRCRRHHHCRRHLGRARGCHATGCAGATRCAGFRV